MENAVRGTADSGRFFKVFANIPISVRNETIAVLDGVPVSWNVAYTEIHAGTPLGGKVLERLIALDLI